MAKPKTGLIILNWNGKKDTFECLRSVMDSKSPSLQLVVYLVDNASTDGSVSAIAKKFPEVQIIQNPHNLGFAAGNNVGIKQALSDKCENIILLNNDTTVAPETFENLHQGAKDLGFDIASPKIFFTKGREFHLDQYHKSELGQVIWYAGGRIDWQNVIARHIGVDEVDHGQFEKSYQTEFATGCCMLIKKKVFDQIGFLDPSYRMYFEDVDFCIRAKKSNFKTGFVADSVVWHKNAGSTGGSGSVTQSRLANQSRLKFALRHAPLRAKIAIVKNNLINLFTHKPY